MSSELIKANGVGPASLASLKEHGFRSLEDLASASVEEVMLVPGFAESRAKQAIASAKVITTESSTTGGKPEIKNSGDKNKEAKVTANIEKKEQATASKKSKTTAKAEKKKQAKASKKAKAAAKAEKKK
jgi:transcription termination factor NusA